MKRAAARRTSAAETPGNAVGNRRTPIQLLGEVARLVDELARLTAGLERVVAEHDRRIAELETRAGLRVPDAAGEEPTP
jgi:hypothetical protein